MIPLMLDLKDKKVCIIGGGEVGLRKAKFFSWHSNVTVISDKFLPEFKKLPVRLVKKKICGDVRKLIEDAHIVIPATDDSELNRKIVGVAERSGKFVDDVNAPGSVIVPSTIRRGDLVIAVSTSGHSPAVSKYVREKLEELIGDEYGLMVKLQYEIRNMLKKRTSSQRRREKVLWKILQDKNIWRALENDEYKKGVKLAKEIVEKCFPA